MRESLKTIFGGVLLLAVLGGVLPATAQSQQQSGGRARHWLGADGEPLPFRNDDEIEDFLRTAEVVETEDIPVGVTDPIRLTLEKDGIRAHAVFRYVEEVYRRERLRDGRLYLNFKDSCRFEPAAYEMARLLGMDNVPPAVERRIGRRRGTVQMWVYNARTETDRLEQRSSPPNPLDWVRQMQLMLLFDALIGNEDRNTGNILIDADWRVWLIDHTRAFYQRHRDRGLDRIAFVDVDFWARMQALDRQTLQQALGAYLSNHQIDRILDRRDRLVELIDGLIAERGAHLVLYD